MRTRIFLCHTHFFKNAVKSCEKILKNINHKQPNCTKKMFLYVFTLLQNSITTDEFNTNLEYCYKLFVGKNECLKLVENINELINIRNIKIFSNIHDEKLMANNSEIYKTKQNFYHLSNEQIFHGTIIENSKYSEYFKDKIDFFSSNITYIRYLQVLSDMS